MYQTTFKNTRSDFGSEQLRTDRDNEYLVVSRVTGLIQAALDATDRNKKIYAAQINNELWIFLADSLISPGNALPDDLKANLLSLAIFSTRHGQRVMLENASLEPLLYINRHIMKGLRDRAQSSD